jgi:hypothetical protein
MTTHKDQIRAEALRLLKKAPQGIRVSELKRNVLQRFPNIPMNTIHGNLWDLDAKTQDVTKPARGLFLHSSFVSPKGAAPASATTTTTKITEEDFYKPFADYLVTDLEECTKAIPLGRNKFKDKWGTPDVLGVREPRKSDIIKAPTEIVAAEIKLDAQSLIEAFGQACAYKLFCHKSYIVVPASSSEMDIDRLEALALIVGIGLILFNAGSPENPDFQIRTRALRHEPDSFFVNQNLKLVEKELF